MIAKSDIYDIHARRMDDMDATISNGMQLYSFEWKLGLSLLLLTSLIGNLLILYFAATGMDRFLCVVGAVILNVLAAIALLALRAMVRGWVDQLLTQVDATTSEAFDELEAKLAEL